MTLRFVGPVGDKPEIFLRAWYLGIPVRTRRARDPVAFPEPLAAILDRAGESRFCRTKVAIEPALWRDAVGARIAERVRPLSIFGDTLVLRVPSSVWANEISLLTEELCARLRVRGVEVRELRFRVGDTPQPDRPPQRRVARTVPPTAAIPQDVKQSLELVKDDALRGFIARAVAANLAWQACGSPVSACHVSEAQRGVRAPRAAGAGTSRPDRSLTTYREGSQGTSETGRGRWR